MAASMCALRFRAGAAISGYVPKAVTAFQVKAQKMPRGEIHKEMAPDNVVRPSIAELAANGGAYIIVSSKGSHADPLLKTQKAAMAEAVRGLTAASSLMLDFYDRRRIASWVNQHAGLVPWVREKLGLPLSGWRPFEDWSSSPASVDAPYLLDAQTRLIGPSINNADGLNAEQALAMLRDILAKPKGVVRLVGLSGVGKTRLIQALFDDRIGASALPRSDALYTDISDEPDPVPQEMLSRLVSMGHRVVLIVDNCGIDLHRKLAAKIASSSCLLSVIGRIRHQRRRTTGHGHLQAGARVPRSHREDARGPLSGYRCPEPPRHREILGGELARGLRAGRDCKEGRVARPAEGHRSVRATVPSTEGAQHGTARCRQACALLYSFDGETVDGSESELSPLAMLAGQSVDQVHKHVAELHRRQLVQKRSKWRAILPHALANRLAKRALEDIPIQRIEAAIVNGASARMLRSFSRRIGYLHDDERAIALAAKWLAVGGLLEQLGKLNTLGEEIFANVAPVNPAATLAFIEETAANNEDWFFSEQNRNKAQVVRAIRSLAYESALFERSAALLQRFVLNEAPGVHDSAVEPLKSLFWLYLSGTHASAVQRAAFVNTLLESSVAREQELGLTLLGEMLKASHFTSHYSFEFGAWKRDFGLHPESGDQVRDWYAQVIEIGRAAEASGSGLSDRVRRVMANHVAELLRTGMFDEVIALAKAFTGNSGWPEGWIGVRNAMRRGNGKLSKAAVKKLEELEQRLRPSDLAGMIRSYALSPEWSALDVADLDEDEELKPLEARQKVYDVCTDLGQQLAADPKQFDALLPEIVASDSSKTFALGRGLATGCDSVAECWSRLRHEFLKIPEGKRQAQLISGFLASAVACSADETEVLLDEVLSDPRLHPYLVYLQANAGVNVKAFERMMKALAIDTVPVSSFGLLASGRAHEGLDDEQLRQILRGITAKEGGNSVATQILGMRVFGKLSDKLPITESLKATGREFLAKVELEKGAHFDHMIGQVIEVAFDNQEYEDQARAFCSRILSEIRRWNVYAWDLSNTITALTKTSPVVILDMLVEQAAGADGTGRRVFQDIRSERACPLDHIADDVWMAWAAKKPETRYELLAQVMRFSNAGDEDHAKGWSSAAMRLIEVAPEPKKILDTFLQRFRPNGWSGSLADTLATRTPLLEALKHHSKPEVAAWANEHAPAFAAHVDRERAREAAEDRARDQTFE
jgi:hypothetical protein